VHVSFVSKEVEAFSEAFAREYGLAIQFDAEATQTLVERCAREGASVADLCRKLFKDYPFGLQLINSNTGETAFVLPRRAVDEPDRYLSDLVVGSYRRSGPQ
jgi:hypothetical protein